MNKVGWLFGGVIFVGSLIGGGVFFLSILLLVIILASLYFFLKWLVTLVLGIVLTILWLLMLAGCSVVGLVVRKKKRNVWRRPLAAS